MKRFKIYALAAIACSLMAACEMDPVMREGGKLPDETTLDGSGAILRSVRSPHRTSGVSLTEGSDVSVSEEIYIQLTGATAATRSVTSATVAADMSLVEGYNARYGAELLPLPAANFEIGSGGQLALAAGERSSGRIAVTFNADGLAPGLYLLPLAVTGAGDAFAPEADVLYYGVSVRALDEIAEWWDGNAYIDCPLDTDYFTIMYLNTGIHQPLLADTYIIEMQDAWTYETIWRRAIGNIVNLRVTQLGYDPDNDRAMFVLTPDMRYVLEHADKYIRPLQDKGRKICFSIEGAGTGLGFCNLTDAQIGDFVAQVEAAVELYGIDGVNLFDRYSNYGKEGMPAMNTTSYPRLIKALREALGPDKLLTVSDYEEPTEYFWDTTATGGISVGDYIDYAWSGYMSENEDIQLLDPYETIGDFELWGMKAMASEYVRKPIAGLDKENYGHFAMPFYPGNSQFMYTMAWDSIGIWRTAGYNPNKMIVFPDIITNRQDAYEGSRRMPAEILQYFGDGGYDWMTMFSVLSPRDSHYDYLLKDW